MLTTLLKNKDDSRPTAIVVNCCTFSINQTTGTLEENEQVKRDILETNCMEALITYYESFIYARIALEFNCFDDVLEV